LSAVVQAAVEEACTMVRGLVERLRESGRAGIQIDPTQLHIMER
jgi:hypothetical protein